MPFRQSLILVSALCAAACGGSSSSGYSSPPPAPTPTTPPPVTVSIVPGARTMTTNAYSPNPLTVPRGTTVTWVNNDTSTHNAASNNVFNTPFIAPGGRESVTFQNAGTFPYFCTIHPGMVGTLTVQ